MNTKAVNLEKPCASALSRFFSAGVFTELAKTGKSRTIARILRETEIANSADPLLTLHDVFELAFSILQTKTNRHEYVYKSAIANNILLGVHSLNTATMLTEFRVAKRKADVVILNGTATAYEIKSERDTLSRLVGQVEAYLEVFATVNVIAGENHVTDIFNHVPDCVGVQVLSNSLSISSVRQASTSFSGIKSLSIFDVLTLKEVEFILRSTGESIPKMPNTARFEYLKNLFVDLPPETAHKQMVVALKKYRSLKSLNEILSEIPRSLTCRCLSTKLRLADYKRLMATFKIPVSVVLSWV